MIINDRDIPLTFTPVLFQTKIQDAENKHIAADLAAAAKFPGQHTSPEVERGLTTSLLVFLSSCLLFFLLCFGFSCC